MRKLAPGAVHFAARPTDDVWKPDFDTPEELMIATMQWKLDVVLKKKLPKHHSQNQMSQSTRVLKRTSTG